MFKRTLSCVLVGGEKFKLRNLPSRTSSLLCSAALRTRSAHRLSWQHLTGTSADAKHSKASAFCFFSVYSHGFRGGRNTFFREKRPRIYLDRAAIDKQKQKHIVT